MISIIIYWLLIIALCYSIGFGFNKLFKINQTNSLNIILGIIVITTFANIFSFFLPINVFFLLCLIVTAIAIIIKFWYEIKTQVSTNFSKFKNKKSLLLLSISCIVFAIYSSGFSNINDDGLYYTQTIMWLNEYGLVHGLSNLHLPLGMCSSWHVFQSIFTFSGFIHFNDINGLILLVFTLFIIEQKQQNKYTFLFEIQYFLIVLISLPFLSAPNPDFAIIVFSAIAIQLFISNKNINFIILIAAFSFSIKISAILVSLIAVFVILNNFKISISKSIFILAVAIVFIHISKNIYQTAYPLYPYKIASLNFDWKTPEPIINFFSDGVKTWAYSDKYKPQDVKELNSINNLEMAKNLLLRSGSKGLINKLILIAFLLSNILIAYLWLKKRLEWILLKLHLITCFSLLIWFLFAPQYRFALPMLIYFLSFIIYLIYTQIIQQKFTINLWYFNVTFLLILFIVSITGLKLNVNNTSTQIGSFNKIDLPQLLIPKPSYKFEMDTILVNNQYYYHAKGNRYCWNSPLPCMGKGYEKIIFDNYKYRISLREKSLKDGFKFILYE